MSPPVTVSLLAGLVVPIPTLLVVAAIVNAGSAVLPCLIEKLPLITPITPEVSSQELPAVLVSFNAAALS
jgi:hypothetical protein